MSLPLTTSLIFCVIKNKKIKLNLNEDSSIKFLDWWKEQGFPIQEIGVEEAKKMIEELEKPKVWRAEQGEEYCYYNSMCKIILAVDNRMEIDDIRFFTGNYFRTTVEAQAVAHKEYDLKTAETTIKHFIIENGLEFTPDWKDEKQDKCSFYYNFRDKEIQINSIFQCNAGQRFNFKSEEDCRKVIDALPNECKTVLGVEEEK